MHGHDEHWLIMDPVPDGRPTKQGAVRLGRELAALHAAGAPAFGAPPPGGPREASIGRAPMRNIPGDDWPTWYAEHRVLPYLRTAVDDGTLRPREAAELERLCARLPGLAGPAEPPARLHGDLWNGNVLWDADGRAWLIDPAAHGGHRETDLAMLHLFGCPHLDRVLDGYQEKTPLADGWRERTGLHQLFPCSCTPCCSAARTPTRRSRWRGRRGETGAPSGSPGEDQCAPRPPPPNDPLLPLLQRGRVVEALVRVRMLVSSYGVSGRSPFGICGTSSGSRFSRISWTGPSGGSCGCSSGRGRGDSFILTR